MTNVHVIEHPTAPVEVWHEPSIPDDPGAPLPAMVAVEVGFPGKDWDDPVFIPVEIARQVAAAILASVPK